MIFNASGGGGSGGTLTVTAPVGVTITVSNGVKTKVKTADAEGKATFKGLATGTWMVTISNGSETATATVEIVADYAKTMAFFAATIAVTYPEGSACTCTDGSVTMTAPNTSGSCSFIVGNTGTWAVSCTDGDQTATDTVEITADGQSESLELSYFDGYLFKDGVWSSLLMPNGAWMGESSYSYYYDGDIVLSGWNGSCGSNDYIDFSKYSTITVYIAGSWNSWVYLYLIDSSDNKVIEKNYHDSSAQNAYTGAQKTDISSVNVPCKLKLSGGTNYGVSSGLGTTKIDYIKLE